MVKKFLVIMVALLMVGCGTLKNCPDPTVIYKDKIVPVYVVPKAPSVERPELAINQLSTTDKEDDGKVVQAYVLSVKQLQQYIDVLETVIDKYSEEAENNNIINSNNLENKKTP